MALGDGQPEHATHEGTHNLCVLLRGSVVGFLADFTKYSERVYILHPALTHQQIIDSI